MTAFGRIYTSSEFKRLTNALCWMDANFWYFAFFFFGRGKLYVSIYVHDAIVSRSTPVITKASVLFISNYRGIWQSAAQKMKMILTDGWCWLIALFHGRCHSQKSRVVFCSAFVSTYFLSVKILFSELCSDTNRMCVLL
jgi:hypothetical protein